MRKEFKAIAATRRDEVAVIDSLNGREWTYAETHTLMKDLGTEMVGRMGGEPGTVVSMLPNCVENFMLFLAAAYNGIGYAPLNPLSSPRELGHWLRIVGAVICFVPPQLGEEFHRVIEDVGCTTVPIPMDGYFNWLGDKPGSESVPKGSARLFLLTSGTTGEPKALVFDIDRLWSSGRAWMAHHDLIGGGLRFLNILPMSYLGGTFNLGLIPLAAEGSVVVMAAFSGRTFMRFWQDVERFRVTALWLVPTIVRGLMKVARKTDRHRFNGSGKDIKVCFLGTAPIDLKTKIDFEQEFGIQPLENYALSETTFITSESAGHTDRSTEGGVGSVLPYIQARIAANGQKSDDGIQIGEIEVNSPFAFLGYLNENGDIELPLTDDGFFRTGDVGFINAGGILQLAGRTREIVKKGGYFIMLREIEVFSAQYPNVEETVAIGVPHDFYGEDIVLFLRFDSGLDNSDRRIAEFRNWMTQNLARHKWPGRIYARDKFPKTDSGKVQKHVLLKDIEANEAVNRA